MSIHDDLDQAYRQAPSDQPQSGPARIQFTGKGRETTNQAPSMSEPAGQPMGIGIKLGQHQSWSAATNEANVSGPQAWRPEAADPGRVGVAGTLSKLYGTDGGGRVTIPGFGVTTADNAVRMGYCKWQGDTLVDVGGAAEQAQNTQAQQPQEQAPAEDPGAEVYPPEEDQALATTIAPLSQSGYDRAVSSALGAMVHRGGDFTLTARNLAEQESSSGNPMTPEHAHEVVLDLMAYHERAAGRAIAPLLGDDPARLDEFSTWLKGDKVRFESALSDLVHQRNPGKLVQAAADFKRRSPGDLSAYTKAGFEVSIGARGETLLRHPRMGGQWMDAALMAKL